MLESLKMTRHFPWVNKLGIEFDNLRVDAPGLDFLFFFFPFTCRRPECFQLSYKSINLYKIIKKLLEKSNLGLVSGYSTRIIRIWNWANMGQKSSPINYQSPIDTNRSHNPQKLQSTAVLADKATGGGHLTWNHCLKNLVSILMKIGNLLMLPFCWSHAKTKSVSRIEK